MTREEAKAYDEALEKARKRIATEPQDHTDAILKDIFPQLRESDNEIHRKWILEYLYDGLRKSDEQFKGQFKSAINWLEKQKEQPEVDLEKEFKTWWKSISGKINVEHIMEWYMHETAHHFYELGLKARKGE